MADKNYLPVPFEAIQLNNKLREPSGLEIAQETKLKPISQVAADPEMLPDELEL